MRNKAVQMSLFDIYNGVLNSIEEKKPELITLLEEHIDFDRLINLLKDTFQTAHRKTFNTLSLKADIFLSGIVQLVGVLLADAFHKPDLIKSLRKLIA